MSYENVPDGYRDPAWNEKKQHPGDVFAMAEKGDLDALDHIGEHANLWIGDEVLAMCFREWIIGSIDGREFDEEAKRLEDDCDPFGARWIHEDKWLAQVARQAIGESIKENWSGRDLARLLTACAQAGKSKLSPEFPRFGFDAWQDMCQQDFEANA